MRSTGTSTAARTASRSASEPPNRRASVRTLTIAAPPASYSRASAAGSAIGASAPFDGLRRFTSAMTWTPGLAQRGDRVPGLRPTGRPLLQLLQRQPAFAVGQVGPDTDEDLVEHGHEDGLTPCGGLGGRCGRRLLP